VLVALVVMLTAAGQPGDLLFHLPLDGTVEPAVGASAPRVEGQARFEAGRVGQALLVGDGVSDLLARPAVELFVGFGGVVHRERVAAGADVYVAAASLAPILPLATCAEEYEQCRSTPHQALFDQGLALTFQDRVTFHHPRRRESFYASYQAFHPRSNRGAA